MFHRRLIIVLALSGNVCWLAAQPAGEKKGEEARPSQEAVLSKDTVVNADLAYGSNDKQRLDVYAPRRAKGAPVLIFVHGGEWTKGDKAAVSFKPKFLNENGIVFASINYRLSPAAKHPAHVSDVAAAVRWLRDHAVKFGGDPEKLVLMGHSAGCHLVTLTALDPRHLRKEKLEPTSLRGIVAWSGGMYDLVDRMRDGGGHYPKYIRQAFGDEEKTWRDASPVTHVGDAAAPPFLFIVVPRNAGKDAEAKTSPADRLAHQIRQAKGQADVRVLADRTHFTANHLIGAPGDTTGQILLDFIRKVTK